MQMLEQLPVLPEAGLSRVISHFCYKPLDICEIYNILMKTKKDNFQLDLQQVLSSLLAFLPILFSSL